VIAPAELRLPRRGVPHVLTFLGGRLVGGVAALLAASVLIFAGVEVLPGSRQARCLDATRLPLPFGS